MQKGIELAKEAVEEDNKQNWQAALDLYKRALEYFTTHLKYDKNPKSRQMITAKVGERAVAGVGAGGPGQRARGRAEHRGAVATVAAVQRCRRP